jgi:hypothetical protein
MNGRDIVLFLCVFSPLRADAVCVCIGLEFLSLTMLHRINEC